MDDLLAAWDGESVSIHRDRESGAWMFICVHSTRLGTAAGGTRMKHYPRLADALADGMRLAEAMSLKFASVYFPHGGGKAVIALPTPEIPQGEARRRLLLVYGSFINSLGGLYSAAPDMNTSATRMDVIGEVTPTCSAGRRRPAGPATPPRTCGRRSTGSRAHAGLHSAPTTGRKNGRGPGRRGVGGRLIELLADAGATVIASDVDARRLKALEERGIRVVSPDSVLTVECDVLAPCAVGGIINSRSIPTLRCRVIAGGANNQLATTADAGMLRKRGIVYAPDFVINAGGVLHGGGLEERTGRAPSWMRSSPGSATRSTRS